jgi:hypothetical protein
MEYTVTLEKRVQYHYTMQVQEEEDADSKLFDLMNDLREERITDFESICEEQEADWLFLDMEEIE